MLISYKEHWTKDKFVKVQFVRINGSRMQFKNLEMDGEGRFIYLFKYSSSKLEKNTKKSKILVFLGFLDVKLSKNI